MNTSVGSCAVVEKYNNESYVLCKMCLFIKIQCKILHVSTGAEMSMKARDLARHFETQSTPVMIGWFPWLSLV